MPLYSYKCQKCNKTKEMLKSSNLSDDPEVCEVCQEVMEKVITCASFKIIGSY